MPSLSTAEYEMFKKLVKKALDSKYFVVRKELLNTNDDNSQYRIILEHGLSSDNILVNIDYKIEGNINNKTTKISVTKVDENKILVTTALPIDFYVTVESNVFTVLSPADPGKTIPLLCSNTLLLGDNIICGSEISELDSGVIPTIKPVSLYNM